MSRYQGPRRRIGAVRKDAEGWIVAVTLEPCHHPLVYRRRQRELRGEFACCPNCRPEPATRPQPASGGPVAAGALLPPSGCVSPGPGLQEPPRRRPRGAGGEAPGLSSRVPPGDPAAEAERRRRDLARLDEQRHRELAQGERSAFDAALRLAPTRCGTHEHLVALEELQRSLSRVGKLRGSP